MPLEPITREENFLARAAGDDGKELEPITRTEHFLQRIIEAIEAGGGEVTAEAVAAAIGQFSAAQAAAAREDLGAAQADAVETVSGATPSITPAAGTIYNCGTLTSLTITNPPVTGKYSIIFFSGATATVVTGIDNFTVEANKRYRIDVSDGYATFDSWPYTTA